MKNRDAVTSFVRVGIALLIAFPQSVWANPSVGSVVAGIANISSSGKTLTVQQASSYAILNWRDFSIAQGELTRFIQPSAVSAALNRVTGGDPSAIYGTLQANGRIYLINPNGITVGPTGVINTQSFIASTLDVSNSQFLSGGGLLFSGGSLASLANSGKISALGGDVVLIAHAVSNDGQISAAGTAALAAGSEVLYQPGGEENVFVQAGAGSAATGIDQKGQIQAATVELNAAGGNVYGLAINNEGLIRATGVENRGGRVYLTAEGGDIALRSGSRIDASGDAGGGSVFVGGGFHGADASIPNAANVTAEKGASISADAVNSGDGGQVAVWSAGKTDFSGSISARGGAAGGNGGYVEVSGRKLAFDGRVDLRAPQGRTGTLLLDPNTWTIGDTDNPGDVDSFISADTLAGNLDGADVALQADNTVTVNSAVNWSSDNSLSLSAGNAVFVNQPITNASGNGSLSLISGPGGINLAADIMTHGGGQTYAGPVNLLGDRTLTSDLGGISFLQTIDGASNLSVSAGGDVGFGGSVGQTAPLNTLIATAGGAINVAPGATMAFTSGWDDDNNSLPAANSVLIGASDITFNNPVDGSSGASNLLLYGSNSVTFNDIAGSQDSPLGSLTTWGTTNINGGQVTTSGSQQYNGPVRIGVSDAALTASNGSISFASTVDSAWNLDPGLTTTSAGDTTFNDAVGSNNPLSFLSANIAGQGSVNLNGGAVITSGAQQYNGPVRIGQDATLTSQSDAIAFASTLDGGFNLTTNSAGNTDFNGAVGSNAPLASLQVNINDWGNIDINGGLVATAGPQGYNGPVVINSNGSGPATTLLDSTNGGASTVGNAVTFGSTLDDGNGNDSLTIAAGDAGVSFGDAVGSNQAFGALTVNSSGGNIAFNGTDNGSLWLGGPTALTTSGAGAVAFAGTVDDANGGDSLAITAGSGGVAFGAAVGNQGALGSLSVTGTTNINGGSVQTSGGGQAYNGPVVLGDGWNSLTDNGGGNIAFASTVDGVNPGGATLNAQTDGSISFGGAVGSNTPLNMLFATAGGAITVNPGATMAFTGDWTDEENEAPNANSILLGANNITFNSPIDGLPANLLLYGSNSVTFNDTVGSETPLASLTTWGTTNINGGQVQTSGNQVYNGSVRVGVNDAALTAANGSISFAGTVDSAQNLDPGLTTTSAGDTTFNGAVGSDSPLSFLTANITAGGSININGGQVTTSGAQQYNGPVRIGADAALTASNGSISFASTVDSPWSFDPGLTTTSDGDTTFNGAVGSNSPLSFLTANITGEGAIKINGGQVATNGNQNYNQNVVIGGEEGAFLTAPYITFKGTLDSTDGNQGLTIVTRGTAFNGAVGNTPLAFLNAEGRGWTEISGGQVTTNGDQNYNRLVISNESASLTSNNGGIAFNGTVDSGEGSQGLTAAAAGSIKFRQEVGGDTSLAYLTTRGGGTTWINGGFVGTVGDQTYGEAVRLGRNTTLDSTDQGSSEGGNITFNGTLDSRRSVSLTLENGSGSVVFNGAVGNSNRPLVSLLINGSGEIDINGGAVLTSGYQSYNGPVRIGVQDAVLTSRGSFISFSGTVDSAQNLDPGLTTNSAGDTTFNGAVGSHSPLSFLQVNVGEENGININGGAVVTSGGQNYNGAVRIGNQDATLTSQSGAIAFAGTVDSAWNLDPGLTVTSAGDTTFNGAVGSHSPLSFLQVNVGAESGININGGAVVTSGGQNYNGAVRIGNQDATLTSQSGAIAFAGTVDSAQNLDPGLTTNSAGDTTFNGAVGSNSPLSFLTANITGEGGAINLDGDVTTAGAQNYAGAVKLGAADIALTNPDGGIAFLGTVDGGAALTIDSGAGDATFGGAVGLTGPLASLAVHGTGTTHIDGGLVATSGAQSYNTDIALGSDGKLITRDADVSLAKSVAGGDNSLTIKTGKGDITWGAAISAGDISIFGKNITMRGDVSSSGDNGVLLVADNDFLNLGSNQIALTGAGRFLIYSKDPATAILGPLTGSQQFSTTFLDGPAPGFTGNGFLFSVAAPVIPVAGSDDLLVQNFTASNNTAGVNNGSQGNEGGVSDGGAGGAGSGSGGVSSASSGDQGSSDSGDLKDAVGSPQGSDSSGNQNGNNSSTEDDSNKKP